MFGLLVTLLITLAQFGNDKHQKLAFGSTQSAYLWKQIMKSVHDDLDKKEFEEPDGIYTKYVNGRRELLVDGTKPHYTNKLDWYRDSEDEEKKNESKKNNNNNNNNKSKSSNSNDDNGKIKKKSSKSLINEDEE